MKKNYQIVEIGKINSDKERSSIELDEKYINGLNHIDGFSHLQVVWWAHLADDPVSRDELAIKRLFRKAPDVVGVFSTRAPARPNPIMVSTIKVDEIDFERGVIYTCFIDAEPGSPVLDIKPYFPMERVKQCKVPEWFGHWPAWAEEAVDFNWQDEINFNR